MDLVTAVKRRLFDQALQLIEDGADVNAPGRRGETALLWAVIHAQQPLVSRLLAAGAEATPRTRGKRGPGNGAAGATPLHFATNPGHLELLRILLAAGAVVDAEDAVGLTPLAAAAAVGSVDAVDALLVAAANPNHRSQPLLLAARAGHTAVVRRLLQAGAHHTPEATLPYPPIHLAALEGHQETVEVLSAAGAQWPPRA
jgi:ankyrin repeat protein